MPAWDLADVDARTRYKLVTGLVVPRPIAWVSSLSRDGIRNLAPFSFFNAFASTPTIVGIGIGQRRGEPKDTLRNILDREEFVVNLVSVDLAEAMNATSGDHAPEVDEFEVAGLTPVPSTHVAPPRVGEARAALECRLYDAVPLDRSLVEPDLEVRSPGTLVLGEAMRVHVADEVVDTGTGYVDVGALDPVGRLAGTRYWRRGEVFDLPRPRIGE